MNSDTLLCKTCPEVVHMHIGILHKLCDTYIHVDAIFEATSSVETWL